MARLAPGLNSGLNAGARPSTFDLGTGRIGPSLQASASSRAFAPATSALASVAATESGCATGGAGCCPGCSGGGDAGLAANTLNMHKLHEQVTSVVRRERAPVRLAQGSYSAIAPPVLGLSAVSMTKPFIPAVAAAEIVAAYLVVQAALKKGWITDKQAHCYLTCFICEEANGLTAAALALLKEAYDEYMKSTGRGGSGWDWKDIAADAQGLLCCDSVVPCWACCIWA